MKNNLQTTDRKNTYTVNKSKYRTRSTVYDKGETYYTFSSLKLINRNITISKSLIYIIKNILFYIMGFCTPILFFIKPGDLNEFMDVIHKITENVLLGLYNVTPFARKNAGGNFTYSLVVGTVFTVISEIFFVLCILEECKKINKNKWIRNFVFILIFFAIWYLNYLISFYVIKITVLFKVLSVAALFVTNIIIDFGIVVLLCYVDDI